MNKRILIIDDEKNMRWAIKKALEKEGYNIYEAENGQDGLEKLEEIYPDLILLDLRMPMMDGMEALQRIKEINQDIPVIMLTAHGTMESAVEAMKLGALDYISKPFDIEELKVLIKKALNVGELKSEVNYLREELEKNTGKTVIGESPKMKKVLEIVERVASTNATILILGESGTGKEVIANTIHYNSDRKDKPYVKVNCGAIPENLIESELFGYEKGAFTGAIARKIGKFERARGGTIFLDEIGELDLGMQVKLLRVLQEREFERVGGNETIKIDIRVIAATNKDLFKMMQEGNFREDLYYRLNVIPIELPALRDRKEDIPLLIEHFLNYYGKEIGRKNMSISKKAMEKLIQYKWSGNIRELENMIERLVILVDGDIIEERHLPSEVFTRTEMDNAFKLPENGVNLEQVEKSLISQALEISNGNQTHAAKLLGITRHTLIYRIEKYNLQDV